MRAIVIILLPPVFGNGLGLPTIAEYLTVQTKATGYIGYKAILDQLHRASSPK